MNFSIVRTVASALTMTLCLTHEEWVIPTATVPTRNIPANDVQQLIGGREEEIHHFIQKR